MRNFNKAFILIVLSVLVAVSFVSAKEVTKWWNGYTTVDDFDFGKVHAFYRAWDYDDNSRVYVTVYTGISETRVRYKSVDLGVKTKLPFAQITEVSANGSRKEYNLVDYPDKFKDFQFTLYSADENSAEFSFMGTVSVFDSTVSLISDKVKQDFNVSDAASVSDITLKTSKDIAQEAKEKKEEKEKTNFEAGLNFLQWLLTEPEPKHPDGTVICSYCHGDGKCVYCHGTGKDPSGVLSFCPKCDFIGNGVCSTCDGLGWVKK